MSIPISGMSSSLALQLLNSTKTQELQQIQNSPETARAIASFKKGVGGITTAKQFVNNYDVYSFVMQAFDLKDQMFGKAMMQQILESDPSNPQSLVNQMADARFTDLYNAMGFTNGGTQNANTASASWQDQIVQRYVQQQYINEEGGQNATVKIALEFQQKAAGVTNWYDILKNKDLGQFMRTVLNIPNGVVTQSLSKQVSLFQAKFDLTTLQDPTVVSKLVQKYAVMSDAKNAAANAAQNPVVSLVSSAASGGSGQYVPATLNVGSIDLTALSASKYYG
jgi:hypothetical protein